MDIRKFSLCMRREDTVEKLRCRFQHARGPCPFVQITSAPKISSRTSCRVLVKATHNAHHPSLLPIKRISGPEQRVPMAAKSPNLKTHNETEGNITKYRGASRKDLCPRTVSIFRLTAGQYTKVHCVGSFVLCGWSYVYGCKERK